MKDRPTLLTAAKNIVKNSCISWAEVFISGEYFDLIKDADGAWYERNGEKSQSQVAPVPEGRKRRSKSDAIKPADVMNMRKRKMTWQAIAAHYRVSVPTLRKIVEYDGELAN